MTVRDVKPFVGGLVVPYFMDYNMIEAVMRSDNVTRKTAITRLTKLWMEAQGHGN